MKTIIEFEGGGTEEHADAAPSINVDEMTLDLIDNWSGVLVEGILLAEVKRVIYEPGN